MKDKKILLTKREIEVMRLLSMGNTYLEIAMQMKISHETVKKHLSNIYKKLKSKNKIEALSKVKLL